MGDDSFIKKLLESFKLEAEDHIKTLNDGFLRLEKSVEEENLQTLFRAAHSLKGASRTVNLESVEGLCQALESHLASIKNKEIQVDSELIKKLYQSVDEIESQIFQNRPVERKVEEEVPVSTPLKTQSIRIGTSKIDRLLQHAEELLLIKLTSGQQLKGLKKLQEILTRWSKEISSIHHEKLVTHLFHGTDTASNRQVINQLSVYFENQQEILSEFRDTLNQLIRSGEQNRLVIGGMVDGVLDDTKEILMQPISTISQGFPRMVRDLAKSLGKEVSFETVGEDIEIDRRILEQIRDPLTHIIRNSVDHGIEAADERKDKQISGSVKLEAVQVGGNKVKIILSDDGRGIDVKKVKEKALETGIITHSDFETMTDQEAIGLIYHVGLSTSPIVTEISGRGVGLNVVGENVEKLGGRVSIQSELGKGTTIMMELPLTLSTFRGIEVLVGDQEFILPTHNVLRVVRIEPSLVKTVENRQTITLDNDVLAFLPLADVLGIPQSKEEQEESANLTVVIIRAADTRVALAVDQILNEQEVFVKSLGKQLLKVNNINAATVMEWGKVIPILDPFDLVKSISINSTPRVRHFVEVKPSVPVQKSILVAEDSVTSRMLLKNILESAGYKVRSAVDGIEAYTILSTEEIDLLLSDVEMPRMTGFELTEKVRTSDKFKQLPVVLCTSRGSKEDREHGISVGADAYIDKSSFMQSNLLSIIDQLL